MGRIGTKTVRFSIAESDFYFKEFLLKMLGENPFFEVVNDCNNGNELLKRLYQKNEDVFVINLFMPIISGLEAIKYIRSTDKRTPIIAYSAVYMEDISAMLKVFPNVFYCQKSSIIIKDILKNYVLSQTKEYEDYEAEWKLQTLNGNEHKERRVKEEMSLSTTDIQIMKLAYEGYSNKDIGERLNLSARTVDTYIKRLTERLGLGSKLDLVRFCVEKGFYNSSI